MINYDLTKIRAIIFDLDGVLSSETIALAVDGTPLRTVNIKDGYAIQLAMKMGLRIAILSGCKIEAVRKRYEGLGMQDIYLGAAVKIQIYDEFLKKYGLKDDEVMFMGDDIPDLEVMRRVGFRELSLYVSQRKGGMGCGRDVIEQTLRAQDKWLSDERAFGW